VKAIMKADPDVVMVSQDATVVMTKACEMFIMDVTQRAGLRSHAEGRKMVTLHDIVYALHECPEFDFLTGLLNNAVYH
ncbi:hypothetical protein KIPB_014502, partial [Kipferlia bialata]